MNSRPTLTLLAAIVPWTSLSAAQLTERISVGLNGAMANGLSVTSAVSADGRIVAFDSLASNLVVGDSNAANDCFVFDRETGTVARVSLDSNGMQAPGYCNLNGMSGDGRFVLFDCTWPLEPGDTNSVKDTYLRDRQLGTTSRVSVGSNGQQGNNESDSGAISSDGQFVAFRSKASNFVLGDGIASDDLFLRDRESGITSCATISPTFGPGSGMCSYPALSGNGRFLAFIYEGVQLLPGDTNGWADIYVFDRIAHTHMRASLATAGTQPNLWCYAPAISADGRFVAFATRASNLVSGDTNNREDVFVRDMLLGTLTRESLGANGAQPNSDATWPSLSADGHFLVFQSGATNLVPGNTDSFGDVYLRDRWLDTLSVASVDTSGALGDRSSFNGHVSSDGRFISFGSDATNLGGPDNGGFSDVFIRVTGFSCWLDADGDSFGDPATPGTGAMPCASNYVDNSLDCDDADPSRYPGAPELPNGVDDDCDGAVDEEYIQVYCTPGTTFNGCFGLAAWTGVPSASASNGFVITMNPIDGRKMGMIFYGLQQIAQPWASGSSSTLCVGGYRKKTGPQTTGGTLDTCTGVLQLDFNAWLAAHPNAIGSPYIAGDVFYAQGWFRSDSAATQTNLTEALRFELAP